MGADMLSSASVYSDRLWLRSSLEADAGSVAAATAAAATAAAPFIMLMLFAALNAAAAVVVAAALSVWQLLDAKTPLPLDLSM